jgi:hypothetical protein
MDVGTATPTHARRDSKPYRVKRAQASSMPLTRSMIAAEKT